MSIEVSPQGDVIDVTLVCDTGASSAGKVLAIPQEVTNFVRLPGSSARIDSITAIDEDDQGTAFDLIFMSITGSLGALAATAAPSDAVARTILGQISIAAADFVDLGGARVATLLGSRCGLMVKPGLATSRSIWIGAITRSGAPTYSVSGIKLHIGLAWG